MQPLWTLTNRAVNDDDAATCMSGGHPKCKPAPLTYDMASQQAPLPGSPGSGSAPGASGPPTTGTIAPGGLLGST